MSNRLDCRSERVVRSSHASRRDHHSGSFLKGREFPVLGREDEMALVLRVRKAPPGDPIVQELVLANLPFVMKVAAEYRNLGLPFEDLVSEGSIGVMEAARHFDPTRGTRFLTYAVWWIRKAMVAAAARQASLVHVPLYQIKKLRAVVNTGRRLSKELGREADREEISREMRMALSSVDDLLTLGTHELSLDEPGAGAVTPLADRLADDRSADPEHELLRQDDAELLRWALGTLTAEERRVIIGRFGLAGRRATTLRELGERMGVSRERVRQLEVQAMERLRKAIARQRRPLAGARRRPRAGPPPTAPA